MAKKPIRTPASPNVSFVNPALASLLPQYYLIRDAISGEPAIKDAALKYLPAPEALTDDATRKRYDDYKSRAVFYNVSRRTLGGLSGQVFMRDPVIKLPSQLSAIEANASGSGISLVQQAKKAVNYTLAYSRCGIHVDYPDTRSAAGESGVVTVAQMESNRIRPTLNLYSPIEIINWRVVENGAEDELSLVVLLESYISSDDGFEIKDAAQFRVLRLDDAGNYVQEIWREPQPTKYKVGDIPKTKNFQVHEIVTPTGPDGNSLRFIPFFFIGGENNDPSPDNPSFYDLASLNIAHYRNSADYEESCFIVGQPTPVATGITEQWNTDVLGGKLNFGSRGGIILPQGATAQLLQASENTMIKEAMEIKERQMIALGAKLVEQKSVQRTATEAKQEKASEGSVLLSSALNVQDAYNKALAVAATFANVEGSEIVFELNTDFDIVNMTPEERRQTIEEWQKGAITFTEMRAILRKAGTATEDDKTAKEQISRDEAEALAITAKAMEGNAPNIGDGGDDA